MSISDDPTNYRELKSVREITANPTNQIINPEYSIFSNNTNEVTHECEVHNQKFQNINHSQYNTKEPLNENPYPTFEHINPALSQPNLQENLHPDVNPEAYQPQIYPSYVNQTDLCTMTINNILFIHRVYVYPRFGDTMHGNPIPLLNQNNAMIVFLINFIAPGLGTALLMCFSNEVMKVKWFYVGLGVLQMILASFIIGWIWAAITSIQIVAKSYKINSVPPLANV